MARDPALGPPEKRMTRMRYNQGPMGFIADQVIKEMQRAGYPAREFNLYRSERQQIEMLRRGVSKAGPFQSAHQYYGASDIIHEKWAWFAADEAPDGSQFWGRLWDCVALVSEKYRVDFSPRISWDPAHIELASWRDFKAMVGEKEPRKSQLDQWFLSELPVVWKAHLAALRNRK